MPLLFLVFMIALAARNVAYNTLTSKVPKAAERARFMSLQSATSHLASSAGAIFSAQLLRERPDHTLIGMDHVALCSMAFTVLAPVLVGLVERGVRRAA